MSEYTIDAQFLPPEPLWQAVEPLLPLHRPRPKGGRPPMPDRDAFFAIFYLLRTGIQWKALPRCLGAASTVQDRFQHWREAGVFAQLWATGLLEFEIKVGLDLEGQALDSAMTKAPLGGEATGPNPTDRGKKGPKRHLLTEGKGLPIGLVVTGANRHDKTQVEAVLDSQPLVLFSEETPHFCADKGYDFADVRSLVGLWGFEDHIKSRGQEVSEAAKIPGYRARRWVCERTHSWMNRFRRLLIRWEKKKDNYLALLHLACAFIVCRHCPVFG
jgi:putative transposase